MHLLLLPPYSSFARFNYAVLVTSPCDVIAVDHFRNECYTPIFNLYRLGTTIDFQDVIEDQSIICMFPMNTTNAGISVKRIQLWVWSLDMVQSTSIRWSKDPSIAFSLIICDRTQKSVTLRSMFWIYAIEEKGNIFRPIYM